MTHAERRAAQDPGRVEHSPPAQGPRPQRSYRPVRIPGCLERLTPRSTRRGGCCSLTI